MIIPASMTITAAERLLTQIAAGVGTVTVPTRGKHHQLGAEAAFVQAFATWANRATAPSDLATYIEGPHDAIQIDGLTGRLYGMAAVLCADRILGRRKDDLTLLVRTAAIERLSVMHGARPRDAARGPQIELICADHLGLGMPAALYSIDRDGVGTLKRVPAFNDLARLILDTVLTAETRRFLPAGVGQSLGSMLHELFRNTEEHALADDQGNAPRKSIRGIHARRLPISPERLEAILAEGGPLAAYCVRLQPLRQQNRDIQLIEISVFDSGPGMGPSWTGRPLSALSVEDEMAAVRECFGKHASRKATSFSGLGLPNVIAALRAAKGLLRLRTGRQALYADLSAEPVPHGDETPDLRPWPSEMPGIKSVGTLFTVAFPLEEHP